MIHLPDDILHLIAEEFFRRRDFGSLLNCTLTCKSMAAICVPFMYRMQDVAPAKKDDIDTFTAQGSRKFNKWARLWQSICTSAVAPETTLMPYVNYVSIFELISYVGMCFCFLRHWTFFIGANTRSRRFTEPIWRLLKGCKEEGERVWFQVHKTKGDSTLNMG